MEHIKHAFDAFLGLATLANLFKLVVVGFSVLPTILTVISTVLAIIWYVMQICDRRRSRKAQNDS